MYVHTTMLKWKNNEPFLFCANTELLRVESEYAIFKKFIKYIKSKRKRINREIYPTVC